ncbi:energy transducer TonB [Flavobacterium aquidurense]|jgi:hypothetical protein|uniref:energy transducer TonB n=1 Tax=Flavobacterium aquidurense TaxID=362413 RepID=UPI0009228B8B|nr:energy transducer TonB [Flavobacterium aquidurense]OXA70126.1 hypothetical protein B0A67_17600 [Flavobacterium aquidurense]SHG14493.1 TonB protein C-terminal [Flavobacterium frigidimaris]
MLAKLNTGKLKVFPFLFFFLIVNNCIYSQKKTDNLDEKLPYKTVREVEVKPEFPGGMEKFYKFVGTNFKISDKEPSGKIFAQFIIETDGTLSDIEIWKNEVGIISGQEFIRVLQKCPKWIPASDNGKPVRVIYMLPITLQGIK